MAKLLKNFLLPFDILLKILLLHFLFMDHLSSKHYLFIREKNNLTELTSSQLLQHDEVLDFWAFFDVLEGVPSLLGHVFHVDDHGVTDFTADYFFDLVLGDVGDLGVSFKEDVLLKLLSFKLKESFLIDESSDLIRV